METNKIKFSDCKSEYIEDTFKLNRLLEHKSLSAWIAKKKTIEFDSIDEGALIKFQKISNRNIHTWNEQELNKYFIGPVLTLVNFNTSKFKIFANREISATIGDVELYGIPDELIATGIYRPKLPFFCLNEYKKQEDSRGDATGQALAAMLVAQKKNNNDKPIYGIYVVGKFWHFMILKDKQYAISKSYAADDEEIFEIYKILKALKKIIIELTN